MFPFQNMRLCYLASLIREYSCKIKAKFLLNEVRDRNKGIKFVKLELKFHPKLFIIPVRNYILIFHQPRMAEINQSINRDIGFDLFTFYCLQFGNISLSFYKNDTDINLLATIKVMSNVYRCYK